MGVVRIKDHDGRPHDLEAVEGWRVTEIIRDHGSSSGPTLSLMPAATA